MTGTISIHEFFNLLEVKNLIIVSRDLVDDKKLSDKLLKKKRLTIAEIMKLSDLNVSRQTIYNMMNDGRLEFGKYKDGKIKITKEEVIKKLLHGNQ